MKKRYVAIIITISLAIIAGCDNCQPYFVGSVLYDGNGATSGTVPIDPSSPYRPGASVTVLGNTGNLAKTGSTFSGWNTKADGSGTTYSTGATFTMPASNLITLYAKWTIIKCNVTYNANNAASGSVPIDSNSPYIPGALVTVLGNTGALARTGYTFSGWNTQSNGAGITYASGSTFTMGSANVILYAKWTNTPGYFVTYNGNENTSGSIPIDSNTYTSGTNVTVLGNTGSLARTGYTFSGWNTQSNGAGITYASGSTFTMGSANVILYAKWTENPKYTVTYNGNGYTGGSVPTDSSSYYTGSIVTVKSNGTMVRSNYTFAGWNTNSSGTGTNLAAGDMFQMGSSNVILYAKWTQNPKYTVTYNGNGYTGGSVPTDSSSYYTGSTVAVKSNGTMVRSNYTFAGWNTKSSGTGTSYAAGDTFKMGSSNVILYAKWAVADVYTALLNNVNVDISSHNGSPQIYAIAAAMPGVSAQGNNAPTVSYTGFLTVPSIAASIANNSKSASYNASQEYLNLIEDDQAKIDKQMREAENRALSSGAMQLSSMNAKGLQESSTSISVGTAYNGVYISVTGNTINTTCRYISTHAYIFVDNRDTAKMAAYLSDYGSSFDEIYTVDRDKFGNENDIDNNGKVKIIFSEELSGSLLGYFSSTDKYPKTTYSASNEGDIFYITTTSSYQGNTVKGTLAHEFQHMIYFDQHYNRSVTYTYSWLNEALSQAAEYYNDYLNNHLSWIKSFLNRGYQGLSLTYWTSSNYGYGAIFIRYLIDQYGDTAIRNMCSTSKIGISAVESATGDSFSTVFNNFTRAIVMSNTGDTSDSKYNFSTLNLRTLQTSGRGGLLQYPTVITPDTIWTYPVYAYQIVFNRCQGPFSTANLSGTYFAGTVFGLTY